MELPVLISRVAPLTVRATGSANSLVCVMDRKIVTRGFAYIGSEPYPAYRGHAMYSRAQQPSHRLGSHATDRYDGDADGTGNLLE